MPALATLEAERHRARTSASRRRPSSSLVDPRPPRRARPWSARARSGGSRASRAPSSSSESCGSTRSTCCASDQSCGLRSITSSSAPSVYSEPALPLRPVGQRCSRRAHQSRTCAALAADAPPRGPEKSAALSRRCHERLGVPLHADHEVARRAPRRPRSPRRATTPPRAGPCPSRSTAWWWKELTRGLAAPQQAGQAAAAPHHVDRVGRLVAGRALAVVDRRARPVGQVLVQRAAAGDVERLQRRGRWRGSAGRARRRGAPAPARRGRARARSVRARDGERAW